MAFKEVSASGELKGFKAIGDTVEGYYMGTHESETVYGKAVFMDFTSEDGDFSIIQTAGLKKYNWSSMQGMKVKIEYAGDKKNPKTGRTFKDFKIYADYEDSYLPFE